MKNLKKFVALLLAGVMAMVMLTACSGGGTGSNLKDDSDAEAKVLRNYSTSTVTAKNDEKLRAVAEGYLKADYGDLDTKFKAFGYMGAFKAHSDVDGKDLIITITARYDYADTGLSYLLKKISNYVDTDHNVSVQQKGDWTNIGVVAKGNNQQSYIGVSIRIKNYKK